VNNYDGAFVNGAPNHGITIKHSHNGSVSNCRIQWVYDGIDLNYINNISFSDMNFYNISSGGSGIKLVGTQHCNFNNIRIHDCAYTGIKFQSGDNNYLNFNNIDVEVNDGAGLYFLATTHHVNVNNFFLKNPMGYADPVVAFAAATVHNITLSNGMIVDAGDSSIDVAAATDIIISHVSIYNPMTHAIYLHAAAKNIDISHCNLYGGASSNSGIQMTDASYVRISDCYIKGWLIDGITTTTATNFSVNDCQILKNGGRGIEMGVGSNISISGCLIQGNVGDGIECDALDSVIITNCIMYGDSFDDNIIGTHKIVGSTLNLGMVTI
jgi:uncharacterized protein YjbI with pentapeptide repeats